MSTQAQASFQKNQAFISKKRSSQHPHLTFLAYSGEFKVGFGCSLRSLKNPICLKGHCYLLSNIDKLAIRKKDEVAVKKVDWDLSDSLKEVDVEETIQRMAQEVKHYLITLLGKTANEASDEEFYRSLIWVLRERIMINRLATSHTHLKRKSKRLYYLSLEWLPGRMLVNNITNIATIDMVKKLIKTLGRDYQRILTTEREPGLGNGGLGRLAACFLDSLATQHYPAMGYGLRYQYGIFEQELWYGVQVERPDCWLLNDFPWEMRRDTFATVVQYGGKVTTRRNKHDEEVHYLADHEDVRALPYDIPVVGYQGKIDFSALTLRLWTTKESPRNFQLARFNAGDLGDATKNTSVTDVLYPNDKNTLGVFMRIKQEYLLVSASLQDIFREYFLLYKDLTEFPNLVRIQINDTHPSLVIPELMRILTTEHEVPFGQAWEIVKTCCSYTNHTVLKESLEEWDVTLLRELLPRQLSIIEKINFDFCGRVRTKFPNDEEKIRRMSIIEDGKVRMAHLAMVGSHKVNGVAAIHTNILKTEVFKDFADMDPNLFINITNGVTQRRWLLSCNPKLAQFLTELIGDEWITNLHELSKLAPYAKEREVQERFLSIKTENKKRLLNALCKMKTDRYGASCELSKDFFLEGDALFEVLIKRIHEYKRQLMKAFHIIVLYNKLRKDPNACLIKRMVLIGGKAAPGYEMAKNIIRLFYLLSRRINNDPAVTDKLKIIFVENYNVSKAEILIPAADLSNQISCAGQEASGTSNMKLGLNGALTIGTEDGANIEMREAITDKWWPFGFGATASELKKIQNEKSYRPEKIVEADPEIAEAVHFLQNGELAENEVEAAVLCSITDSLLHCDNPDRYFVLKDLRPYITAQEKVEALYKDPHKWAETALHNISSMGQFSSDESIKNYAEKIWGLPKSEIDAEELKRVEKEFWESDRLFTKERQAK